MRDNSVQSRLAMVKEKQRIESRKSPIPTSWKAVKGIIKTGRHTPTQEKASGVNIFCDESTGKDIKFVKAQSSRHKKVVADVDSGYQTAVSVSSAESRAKRVARSRQRVAESTKKKTRNHLNEYSGSPQHSRRRDRSQSRSPVSVVDHVTVVHEKSPKRKSRATRPVVTPPLPSNEVTVPQQRIRPKSRVSQFVEDENSIINPRASVVVPVSKETDKETDDKPKSVKWHNGVKSCRGGEISTDDDCTEDGTWTTGCSDNYNPGQEILDELLDCGYFCHCLMEEIRSVKGEEYSVKIKQ